MGVSSDEYGKALDALLSEVVAPNRTVLMFELPLLPNRIAYGQIQRRLSGRPTSFGFWSKPSGHASSTGFVAALEIMSVLVECCRSVIMTVVIRSA